MQKKIGATKSKLAHDEGSYLSNPLINKSCLNLPSNLMNNLNSAEKNHSTPVIINNASPFTTEPKYIGIESNSDYCLLRRNGYIIREVTSLKQRLKVNSLIKRMYASRGYTTKSTTVFSLDKNQLTFEACNSHGQLGTLSLIIDSGKGLLADQHYQQEIDAFRNREASKVCEVSKLAFKPSTSSKEIFASLFHIAYLYAYHIYGVKNAFIEINPRHASFYKRMLGFEQIGEERICKRVDAPAVLLHLDLEHMREKIAKNQTSSGISDKSIYTYFLNKHEEQNTLSTIKYLLGKFHNSDSNLSQQQSLLPLGFGKDNINPLYRLFSEITKEDGCIEIDKYVYC